MKSFLLNKTGTPVVRWSLVPDGIFYEGEVPKNYYLAVSPGKYIVLDVDEKNGKSGHSNIPIIIFEELLKKFNYHTKSSGAHYWLAYTGSKILMNTSTRYGLDLRIGEKPGNAGGFVKYHHNVDIRQCEHLIKPTSKKLNKWLENLFTGVNNGK